MFNGLIRRIKGCKGCNRRRSKLYRWLAKGRLIRRYEYLNEVDKLMEEFVTQRILDGGSQELIEKRRKELIQTTAKIGETKKLIKFLRNI